MYKCKICGKKYTDINTLYNHIEQKHGDMIPKDMTVEQYYYFMKTGKRNGNCVMCKQMTTWNKNTHKYNRFCGNPRCKEKYVEIVKGRMIAKYGKVHLLNDPNKQREMLANRKISGKYRWEGSNIETTYTGSYELDFLKTLDIFFDWDPEDISMPSPHTYTYEYEGEQKFYIPDAFIHSLDLEIEIKDGGDNPNNHHKIQAVDKEKERLKDEVMKSQKMFHYVKLTNKNYTNFFDFLKEVKDGFEKYGDDKKIPRIFKTEDIRTKSVVQESYDLLEESVKYNKNRIWVSTDWHFYKNKDNKQFKVSKNIKEILNNYKKCVKPNDIFIFLGDLYDARTIFDMELVPEIFKIKDLKGYKIMIKGNHDVNTTDFYLNLGFDEVYDSTYNIGNVIFSHEPVAVGDDEINIHGHIHFSNTYWNVSEINHLDAYIEHYNFKPVLLTDLINEYRNTGRITDMAIMNFDNYLSESYDMLEEANIINGAITKGKTTFNRINKSSLHDMQGLINMNFDARKNNINSMKSFMMKMGKSFNYEKDLVVIKNLLKRSYDHYEKEIKTNPDLKEEYYNYRKWVDTDLRDEIEDRLDDIRETAEYEELMEKFEPDKFLVWFDKPLQKLKGGKIKVYHGSLVDIKDEEIAPRGYNVGATKYSDPRWSTYVWDNREDALDWAIVWAVSEFHKETMMMGHNGKNLIGIPDGMTEQEFGMQLMEKMRGFKFYVYECETDIKNLEIGSCPSIKEYTVSKNLPIVKKYEYMINRELLRRFFKFVSMEEIYKMKKDRKTVKNLKLHRGFFFNHILDNSRDSYRAIMRTDFQNGNIQHGDDLSFYKDIINHHVKLDTYGLKENCIYESSISLSYINTCLQKEYDGLLKQYLQDYTDFYHRMLKERPDTVPHINNDIKRAILFIDDLSKKGNVSNDLLKSAKWCLGDLVNLNKNTKPIKHSNHTQSLMGMSINTESFKEELNKNIWVGADWHFYTKYNDKLKENPNIDKIINNFNRKIKNGDLVIFIGDLYDARRIYNKKEMPKLDHIKKLKGYKIFVKGNHDVDPDQTYYDLGFDLVCTRHEIGNLVFTHEPVAVNENQINIHGHLHYCRDYWYIKPTSHIDVYTARFNYKPITVVEAIEKYTDGMIKPLALNTFNELFGTCIGTEPNVLKESTEIPNSILKVKVLCNPESRNIFTLNDKSSQIIINEHYVIQRDMKGTNCSITQGQCDETNKKILEFDVVFNENLNIDVLIKEKIESGVQISSLFNPDDIENRFIREMSMKLFGLYPDRCEMYR